MTTTRLISASSLVSPENNYILFRWTLWHIITCFQLSAFSCNWHNFVKPPEWPGITTISQPTSDKQVTSTRTKTKFLLSTTNLLAGLWLHSRWPWPWSCLLYQLERNNAIFCFSLKNVTILYWSDFIISWIIYHVNIRFLMMRHDYYIKKDFMFSLTAA